MSDTDKSVVVMFMKILSLEENTATALVAGGLTTIEEVAYIPVDEFLEIEGLDPALVPSFRARALKYLLDQARGHE